MEKKPMSIWMNNAWYVAMYARDLLPGQTAERTMLGQPIVLYRSTEGKVGALQDRCPHRYAPLSRGRVTAAGHLQCGYHGLEFNASGACVRNPHPSGRIPAAAKVRSYQVQERFGAIWVWMGAAEPDMDLPDLGIFEPDSGYQTVKPDWVRMDAPYDLIVDNLLDFSHVSFLHDGILGNEGMASAEIKTSQDGDAVTVERSMPNVQAPEYFALLYRDDCQPVDIWNIVRWQPPSSLRLEVGVTAAGAPRQSGTGLYAAHMLTPETESSTLFHFLGARWNPMPRSAEDDSRIAARLGELRRLLTAEQDNPMIRAQHQRIMQSGAPMKPMPLEIDGGVTAWRRVMAKLIAREDEQSSQVMAATTSKM
jgi:phenylpropionate dioxygenase-like ring-hydroxylating dioxygenase large terminal subunit